MAVEAEIEAAAARLSEAHADIARRQRELAAVAKLDLPPQNIIFQFASAWPAFQVGTHIVHASGGMRIAMLVLASVLALFPVGMGVYVLTIERRLLRPLTLRPRLVRARVDPDGAEAIEDAERVSRAEAGSR